MITKRDLIRLRNMLNDFRYEVYDMNYMKRCLWSDMMNYLDTIIQEEFENEDS